jgi:hypothetical protein
MKRIITLFFLMLVILILTNLNNLSSNNIQVDKTSFQEYTLLLDELNINTNNMANYFKDIEILYVEPSLSPIIDGRVSKTFNFNHPLITRNINLLVSYYRDKLLSLGLKEQVNQIDYLGLKINKMKVITTSIYLNVLLEKLPKLKYE